MKKPEYAALTAYLYRKYTDLYLTGGREHYHVDQADLEQLMDLYNRGGFTDGYFYRHNGQEMMSVKRPNHSGLNIGQGRINRRGEMEIQPMKDLGAGDVLELPDGQSVKLDKAVSVGGQLKVKYTGKPFKQTCSVM